jgi:DNA-binding MarR family transcriptional regulator
MNPSLLEEIILGALRQSDYSLTIMEIAERAGMHRVTASKYLAGLEAKGRVERRNVGRAKLYSAAKAAKVPAAKAANAGGSTGDCEIEIPAGMLAPEADHGGERG